MNNSGQDTNSTLTINPPELPKGGGAIQGIGETFQADEFTGTASFSVPLPASPGRGFEPSLALTYSSGGGNSHFGLGWDLAIPSISRKTSKGQPRYNQNDTFVLSSAEDLVAIDSSDATVIIGSTTYILRRYRPRVEAGFTRIEYWQADDASNSFWRTITADNITSVFGYDQHSRIVNPDNPAQIFEWLLTLSYDAHGNAVFYQYKQEDDVNVPDTLSETNRMHTAQRYLQRVCYGNATPWVVNDFPQDLDTIANAQWHFEVVFDYGEYTDALNSDDPYTPTHNWLARADAFSRYDAGFELRTHRLCRNVLLFHRFVELDTDATNLADATPRLTQRVTLNYDENATLTRLSSVSSSGYRYQAATNDYQSLSLPAVDFGYTTFTAQGHTWQRLQQESGETFPDWDGASYRLVDVHGEGIPGVLYLDGQSVFYWQPERISDEKSNSATQTYHGPVALGELPLTHKKEGISARLMDLSGNGQLDWVSTMGAATGFFQGKATAAHDKYQHGAWEIFQTFESMPTEFFHPQTDLIDATGDGLSDLVLLQEREVRVYPSKGKRGFERALTQLRSHQLPTSKAESAKELLQFVDLLGTGRQHRVRVCNGSVECWPNLGYGRFGDKIELDNAPDFGPQFDTQRLFLADIDGSGATDLIYAHSDHVAIYFNHSGNDFSIEPLTISLPSPCDNIDQISFADIKGNGTQCLVFAERKPKPRQWFYDFCQGSKPYLLNRVTNNRGAETEIRYTSSTQFYLQDKEQGQPWLTALPFPVQVVRQVLTHDLIGDNVLTLLYSYHHGYYDEVEREFRGFGRVERQDAEVFSDTGSPEEYVAPARSITWYHTGAAQQNTLTQQYRSEYYQGDPDAAALADSSVNYVSAEVDEDTQREAQRALKGQILREELYGLDDGDASQHPYSVAEHRYHVRQLQQRGDQRYAVFFAYLIENLDYAYERNPADPKFSHKLVLAVNEYGTVVQTAQLAYGRRSAAAGLPEQESIKVTSAINRSLNNVFADHSSDSHQIGLAKESLSFEITNLSAPSGDSEVLDYDEIKAQLCAHDPETQLPFAAGINSRLLNWQQHYYIAAGSDTPLAFGTVDAQALPSHSEQVVFTEQQINAAPQGLQDQMTNGGYSQHDGYWWNPDSRQRYHTVSAYCLPSEVIDPLGNSSTYDAYDTHWLMLLQTTDALGNTTTAQQVDYQVLQAQQIIDINGNTSEALFDALGQVLVTSFYGTENGNPVGFDPLTDYTMTDAPDSDSVINDPATYLQNAATYFYYDLSSWQLNNQPVRAVQLTAEDYPGQGGRIPIAITYSDGLGRTLQSKVQVESGEALAVNANDKIETITATTRWLTSNRVVYNNKGEPVKQYKPYYSNTHDFIDNETLNSFGVKLTLHYDPLGRVIRTDTAKGFFTKVEFNPWSEQHYDENDTVTDSDYYISNIDNADLPQEERTALQKAAVFYDTPAENILDNLGRTIRSIQRNKTEASGAVTSLTEHYSYDVVGNQLSSADARLSSGNTVNFETSYNLANEALHSQSADAGESWMLSNVMGNPLYRQDARGIEQTFTYDELNRPISEHITGNDGQQDLDHTVTLTLYGENQPNAQDHNLRGQVYQHYDQAGMNQTNSYSLQGRTLSSTRQLRSAYQNEAHWPADETQRTALLETETFTTSTSYDALARVKQTTDADNNSTSPAYHISGRLNQLVVQHGDGSGTTDYVQNIHYNAKSQRQQITYGNGVTTHYHYEDTTFRLTRINSQRSDQSPLQDLNYTYDAAGNITQIEDKAWNTVFNNNLQVDPKSEYTYDALYRLIEATGRAHESLANKNQQQPGNFDKLPSMPAISNAEALINYTLSYQYDQAGNLNQIHHASTNANWTRDMIVANNSSRAVEQNTNGTITPNQVDDYFDHNGNQIQMDGINALHWNYRNNIAHVEKTSQLHEYYVYDSSGQRVRKITENTSAAISHYQETIYLGSLEIHRKHNDSIGDSPTEERYTLRISNDEGQVANREHWTVGSPPSEVSNPQVRYQLENYLGSASMEVDEQGLIISYEEYFPYGGTSFIAGKSAAEVSLKRYRYSGKERDDLTGFYYYGARYYAPWIGRWLSADPAGTVDGLNLYAFVGGNPVIGRDTTGLYDDPKSPELPERFRLSGEQRKAAVDNKNKNKNKKPQAGKQTKPPASKPRPLEQIVGMAAALLSAIPNAAPTPAAETAPEGAEAVPRGAEAAPEESFYFYKGLYLEHAQDILNWQDRWKAEVEDDIRRGNKDKLDSATLKGSEKKGTPSRLIPIRGHITADYGYSRNYPQDAPEEDRVVMEFELSAKLMTKDVIALSSDEKVREVIAGNTADQFVQLGPNIGEGQLGGYIGTKPEKTTFSLGVGQNLNGPTQFLFQLLLKEARIVNR